MEGLVHLYYGDGKGKTTAAAGLALRAAGNNMQVVFTQFLKGSPSGEAYMLNSMDNVTVIRNKEDMGFFSSMDEGSIQKVRQMHDENLDKSLALVYDKKCDLLVLDEICAAYELGVISRTKVDKFILEKPGYLELVLTGRNPAGIFMENADYITKMEKVKHPFDRNINARKGIEY